MIHRYLDNGLEVYIQPVDFAPVVAMQLVVNTGSQDELPGEEGMAHLLEHMLFKGCRNYPAVGSLASTVEQAGGDINAYTTFDHTNYHITAPKNFASEGLDLLLDMVFFTTLDPSELTKELEVVLEEIRRGRDSPGSRLAQNAFSQFYQDSPLQRPVIGYENIVRTFQRDHVLNFYNRWYVPNNALLVMVGDFNEQEVWQQLQKWNTQVQAKSLPARIFAGPFVSCAEKPYTSAISTQTQPKIECEFGQWQEARMHISLPAVALEDAEAPLWDVCSAILGDGLSSRLVRAIKEEQELVTSISCGVFSPKVPYGMFSVSFYGNAENTERILRSIKIEFLRLANDAPSVNELERVLNQMRANRFYTQESMDGLARHAQFSLATAAKMDFETQYLARMEKITPTQIQNLAKHIVQELELGHFVISGLFAEKMQEKAKQENWTNLFAHIFCANISENPQGSNTSHSSFSTDAAISYTRTPSKHHADVEQIILPLPGNRTLHINLRLSNRLPLISGLFSTYQGLVYEHPEHKSSAYIGSQMLTRGTLKQNYNSFMEELEHKVCQISSSVSKDFFTLKWEGLSEHSNRLCEMTLDALLQPAFSEDEFRKLVTETQEVMTASLDSPSYRLSRLLGPLIYKDHPYGRLLMGDTESLQALTLQQAEQFWEGIFSHKHFVLSLTGQIHDLDLWVQRWHSGLSAIITELNLPIPSNMPRVHIAPNATVTKKVDLLNREQLHMVVAWEGVPVNDDDRLPLEVAVQILAGQGGRLFLDLRDQQSLAYTVQAYQSLHRLGGLFQTYIATAPQKCAQAIQGLTQHVHALANQCPPTAEEVARAKASLLGGMAIESQHYSYQASQLAVSDLYGFEFDHFLLFAKRLETITPEQVRQAVQKILDKGQPFMVFVGPEADAMIQEDICNA